MIPKMVQRSSTPFTLGSTLQGNQGIMHSSATYSESSPLLSKTWSPRAVQTKEQSLAKTNLRGEKFVDGVINPVNQDKGPHVSDQNQAVEPEAYTVKRQFQEKTAPFTKSSPAFMVKNTTPLGIGLFVDETVKVPHTTLSHDTSSKMLDSTPRAPHHQDGSPKVQTTVGEKYNMGATSGDIMRVEMSTDLPAIHSSSNNDVYKQINLSTAAWQFNKVTSPSSRPGDHQISATNAIINEVTTSSSRPGDHQISATDAVINNIDQNLGYIENNTTVNKNTQLSKDKQDATSSLSRKSNVKTKVDSEKLVLDTSKSAPLSRLSLQRPKDSSRPPQISPLNHGSISDTVRRDHDLSSLFQSTPSGKLTEQPASPSVKEKMNPIPTSASVIVPNSLAIESPKNLPNDQQMSVVKLPLRQTWQRSMIQSPNVASRGNSYQQNQNSRNRNVPPAILRSNQLQRQRADSSSIKNLLQQLQEQQIRISHMTQRNAELEAGLAKQQHIQAENQVQQQQQQQPQQQVQQEQAVVQQQQQPNVHADQQLQQQQQQQQQLQPREQLPMDGQQQPPQNQFEQQQQQMAQPLNRNDGPVQAQVAQPVMPGDQDHQQDVGQGGGDGQVAQPNPQGLDREVGQIDGPRNQEVNADESLKKDEKLSLDQQEDEVKQHLAAVPDPDDGDDDRDVAQQVAPVGVKAQDLNMEVAQPPERGHQDM